MKRLGVCLVTVLLLLPGCWRDPLEPGVVAKVNGAPIPLADLEFLQSQGQVAPAGDMEAVFAALQVQYGQALAALVVQELVAQELSARGLGIDEAELRAVEAKTRQGYQGRAFEDVLSEEGLDYQLWRRRLKARLDMDTFVAKVLRPQVSVSVEEVQRYYKEHAGEFAQGVRVKFLCVESKAVQPLQKALDAAKGTRDPADMLQAFDDVTVRAQASPEEKLPPQWREALKGLAPGQAGAVRPGGLGFQALVFLERTESKVEGPVRVYPLVEKRLVEDKLCKVFAVWLDAMLARSQVEVNPALTAKKGVF